MGGNRRPFAGLLACLCQLQEHLEVVRGDVRRLKLFFTKKSPARERRGSSMND